MVVVKSKLFVSVVLSSIKSLFCLPLHW
uniref:Uncharacterized protein n=1 Tax=Rhizophora mucronata TaxID=61149 RepID=A0A2P2QBN4_RHIMU